MGANVWKRESGGTSSSGVKRSNEGEAAAQEKPSTAATGSEEAGNQPWKKQRLSTAVAPAHPAGAGSIHAETLAGNPAPAVSNGVSAAQAEPISQPIATSSSPQGSIHPGQQQHPGRHRGRGRGCSHSSRGVGGRHHAGPGRGRGLQEIQNGGQQTVASAGQSAARGGGRAGGRVQSGRSRGGGGAAGGRTVSHQHQQQQQSQAAAAAAEEVLKAKERELEALKAKIAQQQAKQDALKAAQELHKHQRQQQQELQQRKSRLNNAFGSAFANAAKVQQEQKVAGHVAAAAGSINNADQAAADHAEVKRVLSSKNDYDVLQLKPGCDKAALKQRYKEMAVRLHPDKCKAADATVAFQRAHKAYMALQAHVL